MYNLVDLICQRNENVCNMKDYSVLGMYFYMMSKYSSDVRSELLEVSLNLTAMAENKKQIERLDADYLNSLVMQFYSCDTQKFCLLSFLGFYKGQDSRRYDVVLSDMLPLGSISASVLMYCLVYSYRELINDVVFNDIINSSTEFDEICVDLFNHLCGLGFKTGIYYDAIVAMISCYDVMHNGFVGFRYFDYKKNNCAPLLEKYFINITPSNKLYVRDIISSYIGIFENLAAGTDVETYLHSTREFYASAITTGDFYKVIVEYRFYKALFMLKDNKDIPYDKLERILVCLCRNTQYIMDVNELTNLANITDIKSYVSILYIISNLLYNYTNSTEFKYIMYFYDIMLTSDLCKYRSSIAVITDMLINGLYVNYDKLLGFVVVELLVDTLTNLKKNYSDFNAVESMILSDLNKFISD